MVNNSIKICFFVEKSVAQNFVERERETRALYLKLRYGERNDYTKHHGFERID